jgi:uncharacterized membrane protein YdjX (TVP38/TMEM64 family)
MTVSSTVETFALRLRRKLVSVMPVIVGGVGLFVILSLLTYLLAPYLPPTYQRIFAQLQSGDWEVSRTNLRQLFESYGAAKSTTFIALQVLQVLVAPIPGQLTGLLGGYLFGFWRGLFFTMIGLTVGSTIAIGAGRLLGEHVVRKLLSRTMLAKFDYLVEKGGLWNFFLIFLLPALPDDTVCLIAGLTRLPVWKLVLVCVLGRLPGNAVLTFVGASVGGNMLIANALLAVAMGAACLVWLFSEEIQERFYQLSRGRS